MPMRKAQCTWVEALDKILAWSDEGEVGKTVSSSA